MDAGRRWRDHDHPNRGRSAQRLGNEAVQSQKEKTVRSPPGQGIEPKSNIKAPGRFRKIAVRCFVVTTLSGYFWSTFNLGFRCVKDKRGQHFENSTQRNARSPNMKVPPTLWTPASVMRQFPLLLAAIVLAGCEPIATVKPTTPRYGVVGNQEAVLASSESRLHDAAKL